MAVDNEIVASRVRDALVRSSIKQQDLARTTGMDPTALSKALNGKRRFSTLELALVAEAVGVAVSNLIRDDRQAPSGDDGETAARVAARAQPQSTPAIAAAMRRLDDLLDIDKTLVDAGFPPPPQKLPLLARGRPGVTKGERLAEQVRNLTAGPLDPLPALPAWAESELLVDVAVEPFPQGIDGLCASRGNYRLILVNSASAATRQRWTAAHEIGHLAAGDGDDSNVVVDKDLYGSSDPRETCANAFAAAFLLPRAALERSVGPNGVLHEPWVAKMLIEHRVSLDALAFRLHNTGLTNAAGRDRLRRLSTRQLLLQAGAASEYQRQQQARDTRRVPSGLLSRALQAYAAGVVSVRVLARLTCRPVDELLDELASPEERAGQWRDDSLLV